MHRAAERTPPAPQAASALSSLKLANDDKEQKLALLEEARAAAGKEAGELRAGLQEVERSRLEARRELQELRRQVPHPRLSSSPCLTLDGQRRGLNYFKAFT